MNRPPAWPPRSHRRLSWQLAEFQALDFETTGLDLRRDAVVSFGLVPVRGGRIDLSGADYQEVSPEAPLSPRSITVHHLRPVDLAAAPPLADVVDRLRSHLEHRFLLAWSAEIEASFLSRALGGSVRRWLSRTVDVLHLAVVADRLARRKAPGNSYTLAEVVGRHGLPVEEAHNALNDALMTAEMFLILASRLAPLGFEDVRSLLFPARALRRIARFRPRP